MSATPIVTQPHSFDEIIPNPDGGVEVLINGEPTLWADNEAMAWESYHAYYEPIPVFCIVGGQEFFLEVQS